MTAATIARPIPVFPLVGSTRVEPGWSAPRRSASSIMDRAIRSLTLPPGFWDSTLARMVALPGRRDPSEPHERRVADQVEHAVGDARTPGHGLPPGLIGQMW